MADVTLYVDGTDDSGNHRFLTLAAAAAHVPFEDLTSNLHGTGGPGILNIEISITSAESGFYQFTSVVTSASYYINIYTTAAARHGGKWDTGKYRITRAANQYGMIALPSHSRLDGIQFKPSDAATSEIIEAADGTLRLSNCIFVGHGNASYGDIGVKYPSNSFTGHVWNCVFQGFATGSSASYAISVTGASTVSIWNCTVQGGEYGIYRGAGTVAAKNVYASGESGKSFSGTITKTNCASSDTTAGSSDGCISNVALNTTQFVNVTAGSEDFHLAGTGSALYGVGADNTGDSAPLNYTTDIDGDTITGRFDIGADWLAATSQFARPASDVADGNWLNQASSNVNLYASIDEETVSDTDYIRSAATPSDDTCTVGLSSISTPEAGTVTMRIRARWL